MSTVDLNLLVHDPRVRPDGILFSCPAFRSRYLGTENRLRAKWLSENRGKWLPVAAAVEAALRAGTERVVEIGANLLPRLRLLPDDQSDPHDVEMTKPAAVKDSSSIDEKAQEMEPPQPVNSSTMPSRDEILVEGGRLLSAARTAAILRKSERTLQRWHAKKYGPPRTKIGNEIFYDERKLSQWIQHH